MNYYLYILKSASKETYYTGVSDDPERRLRYHNSESKGYTQRYRPWKLVFAYRFETKEKALIVERKVKSWKSKKMIRFLVEGKVDIRNYLD